MTPDEIRELLADHYTDVAPTGACLTALNVDALRQAWSAILVDDYDSTHVAIVDDAIQSFLVVSQQRGNDRMNERSVRYLLNAFDEDMEKAGYYRAPECEKCGGWRVGCMHEGRFSPQHCADASDSCPKCGGSGHVSMVALDVDVEALREAVNLTDLGELVEADWQAVEILYDLARQVLAALDADS